MDLLHTYRQECQDLCCEPIAHIISALEKGADDAKAVRANGNSPELFHTRIAPLQLIALCQTLAQHAGTAVELLDLSYNDRTTGRHVDAVDSAAFGDAGAEVVARLLQCNTGLKCLLLEGNAISAKGAHAICASLGSKDNQLQLLNLANNPIGDSGAESVAALLRTTTALKVVDVGNCDIGLNGVLYLASALAELPSPVLETLILEGCHIMQPPQDHTTLGLAKMLSVNTNLRQLYLPKIGLRDCDFEVLVGSGLTKNDTLEVLDLRANKLSGMAAMHLARLLQENSHIQVLHLAKNGISDECILAIVESLPHNTTLQELDLQNCGASDAGMDILAKALTQCKTLKQGPQEHLVTDVEPVEIDGLPSIVFVND